MVCLFFWQIIDFLCIKTCLKKFFNILYQYSRQNQSFLEECIYSLDAQCKNRIIDIMVELKNIYNLKKHLILATKQDNDSVIMRRAIMTISKIEFFRPMSFLRSRFSNMANLDYSLRITLSEDNNRLLNGTYNDTHFIKNNFKFKLLNGIIIGNRRFEFLGSSSSQMRENGIIFYSNDNLNKTAQSMREMFGPISQYKRNVAKYIARFGLVFSQVCFIKMKKYY